MYFIGMAAFVVVGYIFYWVGATYAADSDILPSWGTSRTIELLSIVSFLMAIIVSIVTMVKLKAWFKFIPVLAIVLSIVGTTIAYATYYLRG